MEREEIVAELRRVAALLGTQSVSQRDFRRHSNVSNYLVQSRFGSWNKAVQAAGLLPMYWGKVPRERLRRLSDSELAEEMRRVHDELGKRPTMAEFRLASKFSADVYKRRVGGSWRKAVARYLESEGERLEPDRPPDQPAVTSSPASALQTPALVGSISETDTQRGVRFFGAPLNFRGLRHEPINEQGVVLLFGMVAQELGFLVEAVGTGFPDCRAKRLIQGGHYVDSEIEFEFKSSNFRVHGHTPEKCDVVVCWENDWPDCPVEVLELKSAIRRLGADD